MFNRYFIAGFLIGFSLGVLLMYLLDKDKTVTKPETEFYKREIKEKDSIIAVQKKEIADREKRDSVIIQTIYKDRIIYKTIYEKIPYSNSVERDRAFDTLLTD